MTANPVPELILSVDPGSSTAWAKWENGTLQSTGVLEGDNEQAIHRLIRGLTTLKVSERTDPDTQDPLLVVENQFLGKNPHTHASLVECRMRWEVIARLYGWRVISLRPATWQSKVINRARGCNTKEKSQNVAAGLLGGEKPPHDIADAICIGLYQLKQLSLPQQQALPLSSGLPMRRRKRTTRRKRTPRSKGK